MTYSITWPEDASALNSGKDSADDGNKDRQLVDRILAGDDAAFELIFERYKRLSAAIAARYFHRPQEVEEIIQTVFAKAYFDLRTFRGANEWSLASWIGKITTNVCLDALRNVKNKPENRACDISDVENWLFRTDEPFTIQSCEQRLIERDLADRLLSRLSPVDRAILEMLHVEGMSMDEAAAVMGWTESRVKGRATRARQALRKIMKKICAGNR